MTATRAIVGAEAADFERTLTRWVMDPLVTVLRARMDRVVVEETTRLRLQPAHRPTLAVPAVDGHAGTGVSGVNSADATTGACPHHHLAADLGFEAANETDGEPIVPLTQAERALHHLTAHLLHQPAVMARHTGQEDCEEAYHQALELVRGLENAGESHD